MRDWGKEINYTPFLNSPERKRQMASKGSEWKLGVGVFKTHSLMVLKKKYITWLCSSRTQCDRFSPLLLTQHYSDLANLATSPLNRSPVAYHFKGSLKSKSHAISASWTSINMRVSNLKNCHWYLQILPLKEECVQCIKSKLLNHQELSKGLLAILTPSCTKEGYK